MWFWREEHNTRPTPIDYAPGIVILAGIVKIIVIVIFLSISLYRVCNKYRPVAETWRFFTCYTLFIYYTLCRKR